MAIAIFLFGAIGYIILLVTFSMLVIQFFSGYQCTWQEGEVGMSFTYFIISSSFSFICLAYFYSGFFKVNGSRQNEPSPENRQG